MTRRKENIASKVKTSLKKFPCTGLQSTFISSRNFSFALLSFQNTSCSCEKMLWEEHQIYGYVLISFFHTLLFDFLLRVLYRSNEYFFALRLFVSSWRIYQILASYLCRKGAYIKISATFAMCFLYYEDNLQVFSKILHFLSLQNSLFLSLQGVLIVQEEELSPLLMDEFRDSDSDSGDLRTYPTFNFDFDKSSPRVMKLL